MKYRVRVDLSFDAESDARTLMETARASAARATSILEATPQEEISFAEIEVCRHDEGLPCTRLERLEVRQGL